MPHPAKITPQEALQRTIEHREIFHDEMLHLMRQIMAGYSLGDSFWCRQRNAPC